MPKKPAEVINNPFTILIDTAEQQPFSFEGFRSDANRKNRPLIVATERECLGRHPDSLGDYTIKEYRNRCNVERKSMNDAHSTLLGFGNGHRERFESELSNLAKIEAACVVVECSLHRLVAEAPEWGKRTAAQNAKSLHRSVIGLQQDYRIPWFFCDTRRLAEQTVFRFLSRFFEKQREQERAAARAAKLIEISSL